jgi:hypothetical protein
MSAPRPADRAQREVRRTVDEDGVVRVELGSGGGARRAWLGAGAAVLVLAGGAAWFAINGLPGGDTSSGVGSSGRAQAPGPQRSNTTTRPTKNSKDPQNTKRAAPLPVGERAPEGGEARAPAGQDFAPGSPERDDEARGDAPEDAEPGIGVDFNSPDRPQASERAGISAFPAPGTKRIKSGIVVPEDFPLPDGYMRHFQATDKGQLLQPILMFHPDYQPLDEAGKPIAIPADRVVPEELAPPGLAVEYLDVPDDAYADSDGPEKDGEEGGGDGAP